MKKSFVILLGILSMLSFTFCACAGELHQAIMMSDFDKAKSLIEKYPDSINSKDETGYTPIHLSILMKQNKIIDTLLKHKADPNIKVIGGITPLHMSVFMDNTDALSLLLKNGADPNMKSDDGYTPLKSARQLGKKTMIDLLVDKTTPSNDDDLDISYPPVFPEKNSISKAPIEDDSRLHPKPVRQIMRKRGTPGSQAVKYTKTVVRGCPVNLITVDLRDSRVSVSAAIAKNGIGTDESFNSFIQRTKPVAAINGSFFSKSNLKPIGDIVINKKLVHFGAMGTGICITEDSSIDFVKVIRHKHTNWSAYDTVMCCGPELIKNGAINLDAEGEGFRDPHVMGNANRTGVGITRDDKLIMVNTSKGVSLHEWANIMKALGCVDAMNLDGGASMGMYYRGKMISTPGRKLTNVLFIYER
ncbi:MAG: phosphodiester glycosidase family protein [Armatimonadota bacterium]